MARQLSIPIENWPEPEPGKAYPVRVAALRRPRKQPFVLAALELLDPDQHGRRLEAQLPYPCRPSGLTAQFVAACGHEVKIGASVRVKDCLGKTVLVRFARTESGDLEVSSFEAIIPEDLYAAPEPTEPDPRSAPTAQADADGDRRR